MGWIGCIRCKKFRCDFVARTHLFGPFCIDFRKATKRSRMHPNGTKHTKISVGLNQVRSLRKILTRLRDTNYCTSSARFASSFVRQPNGPKRTQVVRNIPKHQFRVQRGGSGAFIAKIPTRLRGTNFCTSSTSFAPSFVRQPNILE